MTGKLTHRSYAPEVRAGSAAVQRGAHRAENQAMAEARRNVTPTPRPHVPASAVNAALRGIAPGKKG